MISFGTTHIGTGVVAKYNAKLSDEQRTILTKYCAINHPHIKVMKIGKGLTRIEGFCPQGTFFNLRCKLDECMAISKAMVQLAKAKKARENIIYDGLYHVRDLHALTLETIESEKALCDNPGNDYAYNDTDDLPF